jgi:hypothetical protein
MPGLIFTDKAGHINSKKNKEYKGNDNDKNKPKSENIFFV